MKGKIHLKIGEFEFAEVEVDGDAHAFIDTECEMRAARATRLEGGGLPQLEWNRVLDSFIDTGEMAVEDYEKLNRPQQYVINEIKKSKKRI